MKKSILIIISFILIVSCQERKYDQRLILADSLLYWEKPDSALMMLNKINAFTLSEHDRLYYDFLRTFTQFKLYIPIKSDSLINRCIQYYSQTDEKELLGRCWLHKGNALIDMGDLKASVACLKKAEQIANEVENTDLKIRVFATLAYVNAETGNHNKALEYIHEVLKYAKTNNRRRWIGHAYMSMSSIYFDIGSRDSSDYYKQLSIDYIKDIPLKEQTVYLNNLSLYYQRNNDYQRAESCLKQSLQISPLPQTYGALASLYTATHQRGKAKELWEKASQEENPRLRCAFMQPYAEWLYRIGEKDSAWNVAMRIPFMKDSIMNMRTQQTEIIKEEQEEHDREMAALYYRHRIELSIAFIISLILLLLLIWSFSYMKIQKKKKQIAEEQATISEYQLQIGQLSAEGKEHEKKTKELERKVSELRKKQGMSLSKGMARYREIIDGGTTIRWRRSDYNDFLEYYRTIDLIFMTELEEDYKQLSGSQKFYLVLLKTGKTEKEAQTVMALSDEAMRTMKSRIAKEKISYED